MFEHAAQSVASSARARSISNFRKSLTKTIITLLHSVPGVGFYDTSTRKIGRLEVVIVGSSGLLEDVVEHLVHVGGVEIRHGNLRRGRDHQTQPALVAYSRHGATSGQTDEAVTLRRRVARRETPALGVPFRGRAVVRRIVKVPADPGLHFPHAVRGRGRLVLLLHPVGRR